MQNKNKKLQKFLKWFWGLYILIVLTVIGIFCLVTNGYFGEMPTFEELENPENNIASEIYSEDNVLLSTIYIENRSYVEFSDLSSNVVNSLIATEDIRFTRHSGIDIRGLIRVLIRTVILGDRDAGGGSTITQQLAKNLFPRDTATYHSSFKRKINLGIAKFKEWVTAIKLERNYTKEEILVMYLNTVDFGSLSYGIKTAAKTFFNTSPDSLKLEEASLLIGVLKAPSWFSPVRNPERSLMRRNVVLSQLNKYQYISNEDFDSISEIPINLTYKVQDHEVGIATYFREFLRLTLTAQKPKRRNYYSYRSYMEDSVKWENDPLYGWGNKNTKPDGEPYNVYMDGLKIYTGINSVMQKYAEESVNEHLKGFLQPAFFKEVEANKNPPFSDDLNDAQIEQIMLQAMIRSERYRLLRLSGYSSEEIIEVFNTPVEMTVFSYDGEKDTIMAPFDSIRYYKHIFKASLMSMDPSTGQVRAYVGGPNFKYFKYDMVTQGKRQVGSTIKPFLYVLAMQEGYSPCKKVDNVPITFIVNDSTWTPKSSGPKAFIGKKVTLEWGLAASENYISAWVMNQFNPYAVIDVIKKMGVTSYIDPVPSLFLGTSEITLNEMVTAFNTFADKGINVSPIFVTRIEDKNGNLLATFTPKKIESINEETAYLMTRLLLGVVNKGTGNRLRSVYNFTNEMGGKTGTTQNHSDGWYIGITPELVTGVWVGADDRSVHFDELGMGAGSRMALPIWGMYMQKIYTNKKLGFTQEDFDKPKNFSIDLDCSKHEEENIMEEIDPGSYRF